MNRKFQRRRHLITMADRSDHVGRNAQTLQCTIRRVLISITTNT
jgi:hypothetical protein